jgi:hypothetical protein
MSDYFIDFLSLVRFFIFCRTPQKVVTHGTQVFFSKAKYFNVFSPFLWYYFEDKKRFSGDGAD